MLYEVGRTELDLLGLMRLLTFFPRTYSFVQSELHFFQSCFLVLCVNHVKGALGCEAVFRQVSFGCILLRLNNKVLAVFRVI